MDLGNRLGLVVTTKAQLKLVIMNLNRINQHSCTFFSSHVQLKIGEK